MRKLKRPPSSLILIWGKCWEYTILTLPSSPMMFICVPPRLVPEKQQARLAFWGPRHPCPKFPQAIHKTLIFGSIQVVFRRGVNRFLTSCCTKKKYGEGGAGHRRAARIGGTKVLDWGVSIRVLFHKPCGPLQPS